MLNELRKIKLQSEKKDTSVSVHCRKSNIMDIEKRYTYTYNEYDDTRVKRYGRNASEAAVCIIYRTRSRR